MKPIPLQCAVQAIQVLFQDKLESKKRIRKEMLLMLGYILEGTRGRALGLIKLILQSEPNYNANPFIPILTTDRSFASTLYELFVSNADTEIGSIVNLLCQYRKLEGSNCFMEKMAGEDDFRVFKKLTDGCSYSMVQIYGIVNVERKRRSSLFAQLNLIQTQKKDVIDRCITPFLSPIVSFYNLILYNAKYLAYLTSTTLEKDDDVTPPETIIFPSLVSLTCILLEHFDGSSDLLKLCLSLLQCMYELPMISRYLNHHRPAKAIANESFVPDYQITCYLLDLFQRLLHSPEKMSTESVTSIVVIISRILRSLKRKGDPGLNYRNWSKLIERNLALLVTEPARLHSSLITDSVCFNCIYIVIHAEAIIGDRVSFVDLLHTLFSHGNIIRNMDQKRGQEEVNQMRTFQTLFDINLYNLRLIIDFFQGRIEKGLSKKGVKRSTLNVKEIIDQNYCHLELEVNSSLSLDAFSSYREGEDELRPFLRIE